MALSFDRWHSSDTHITDMSILGTYAIIYLSNVLNLIFLDSSQGWGQISLFAGILSTFILVLSR